MKEMTCAYLSCDFVSVHISLVIVVAIHPLFVRLIVFVKSIFKGGCFFGMMQIPIVLLWIYKVSDYICSRRKLFTC